MIKYIDGIPGSELAGKRILLRVDFNVPVKAVGGQIAEVGESFKIRAHKETLDLLIKNGARVALISHISAIASFNPIVEEVGDILEQTLTLIPWSERDSLDKLFQSCPVVLLENIRQNKGEAENDSGFALDLAKGFDLYINDAFSVSHRRHTSVTAVTEHLPAYGGLLLKKEIENLSLALNEPAEGKILVLGGAKISTKLPVIKNFLDKAEKILIGGAIANDFFQARGVEVGVSTVDNTIQPDISDPKIILPEDMVVTTDKSGRGRTDYFDKIANIEKEQAIVDIGRKTVKVYEKIIAAGRMVIWNGPLGLAEVEQFADGTNALAAVVSRVKYSIVGGGDTIAAIDKLGLLGKYTFVSTAGGAMLEFLSGKKLPGLEALGYYG